LNARARPTRREDIAMARRLRTRGRRAVRPIVPARRLAGGALTGAATADVAAGAPGRRRAAATRR
jgi:hypothetical protein